MRLKWYHGMRVHQLNERKIKEKETCGKQYQI